MGRRDEIIKRLVDVLGAYEGGNVLVSCQGQAMDGYSALANFVGIAEDAREILRGKVIVLDALLGRVGKLRDKMVGEGK